MIVTVASLKGGTGKSTIVTNLAMSWAARKKKVLVFDSDFGANNMDLYFNVEVQYDITDYISGAKTLEEIIIKKDEFIHVISGNSGTPETANLSDGIINKILCDVNMLKDKFDIIIVDTAPTMHNSSWKFCMLSDKTVMVVNPQFATMMDVYKLTKHLIISGYNSTNIGILANKVTNHKQGQIAFDTLNNATKRYLGKEISYLGQIENSRAFEKSDIKRTQVYAEFHNFRKIFDDISDKITK